MDYIYEILLKIIMWILLDQELTDLLIETKSQNEFDKIVESYADSATLRLSYWLMPVRMRQIMREKIITLNPDQPAEAESHRIAGEVLNEFNK